MTDTRKLLVTYLDADGAWERIAPVLSSRLPLVQVEWTNPVEAHRGPRIIPRLELDFVRFTPEVFPKNVPGMNVHRGPFLHLYFVNCEEVDIYRKQVRKAIQDWVALLNSKRNQEWMIVFVTTQEIKPGTTFLSMRNTTVLDKLRVAVLQGSQAGDFQDPEGWKDFLTKLTTSVLSTLSAVVSQYDENMKRLEAQRMMPGWNYCQFFVIKEGLASTYEVVGLYDDALMQCDELELSFYQTLAEQGAPWFRTFGGTDAGDDSADILDVRRKPYRDLIAQNKTSIFDLRIFLFARQIQLLFKLNLVVNVCLKAKAFITAFARTLALYEPALLPFFTCTWVYSSCLNVITRCDDIVLRSNFPPATIAAYEAIKAELLHLARLQVDKFGLSCGFLTQTIQANALTDATGSGEKSELQRTLLDTITRADLRNACKSEEAFDALYMNLTEKAIASFQMSGRYRSMWLLKGDVAALHFERQRYDQATQLLEDMSLRYSQSGWGITDIELLEKLATCAKVLGAHEKHVVSCLRLLESLPTTAHAKRRDYEKALAEAAYSLPDDVVRESESVFHVELVGLVHHAEVPDGSVIALRIFSSLEEPFFVDSIELHLLAGNMSGELSLRSGTLELAPGGTEALLQAEEPLPVGTYTVEKVTISKGRLRFVYNLLQGDVKYSFHMTEQPKHVWPSTWRLNAGSSKLLTVRLFVGDLTVSGGTLSVSRQPGDGQKASVNLEAVGDDCSRTVPLAACDPQSFLEVVLQDLDRDQEQHDALSFAASLVTSEGSKFQKWESVPCAPFICSGSSSIPELLTIALRPDDTPLPVAVLSALSSAEVEPTKDIFPGICGVLLDRNDSFGIISPSALDKGTVCIRFVVLEEVFHRILILALRKLTHETGDGATTAAIIPSIAIETAFRNQWSRFVDVERLFYGSGLSMTAAQRTHFRTIISPIVDASHGGDGAFFADKIVDAMEQVLASTSLDFLDKYPNLVHSVQIQISDFC